MLNVKIYLSVRKFVHNYIQPTKKEYFTTENI